MVQSEKEFLEASPEAKATPALTHNHRDNAAHPTHPPGLAGCEAKYGTDIFTYLKHKGRAWQ